MMAALILVFSLAALLQFFVSYCRSLIAASSKHRLSLEAQDVTGISSMAARAEDFPRVMQLLQLCPERPNDGRQIRAVQNYFRLLGMVRWTLARLLPSLPPWTDVQRAQCAYFAAVALDRRIAFSRDMLASQMGNGS